MDKKIKKSIHSGSFWEAIAPIIRCSQIIGIIPLKHINANSTKSVHFSWFSISSLMWFILIVWDLVILGSTIHNYRNEGISSRNITTLIFYSMGVCIYGAFMQVARRWVEIITGWTELEQRFLQPPYVTELSKKLKSRLIRIGICMTVLAVGEHSLYQGSKIYAFFGKTTECNITNRRLNEFFPEQFPSVYKLMPSGFTLALTQKPRSRVEMDKKIKKSIHSGSFWEAIAPIIRCSQIFGIIPLKRINANSTKSVHFSWFSISSLMWFILIVWDLVIVGSTIHNYRNEGISAGIITTLIFHSMGVCIYGAFMQVARRWVEIITGWTELEQRFLQPPYVTELSKKLKSRLIRIGICVTVLAVGEHLLFQGSKIYAFFGKTTECNITNRRLNEYFPERFPYVYKLMPSGFTLALTQFVSILGTAAWNFLDLFIILISIGISTRFEQLTSALGEYLQHHEGEASSSRTMLRFRMDFIAICDLLAYVDSHMGILIFSSAVNNLFYVCNQLVNVFNPLRYYIDYVYYWYSLLYLLGRTLYLFITAAGINEAAESPKVLLHNIPSEDWNEESSRFLFQINSKTIALSAMGFCNFTRRLILTMAGAIVTFELVMMQLSSTGVLSPLCG